MLTSYLICDVISFVATRKCQKSEILIKVLNIEGEQSPYILNSMEAVAYDKI